MVLAFVVYGLGIGCHEETAHAFEKAGAKAEIIHINQLLSGEKSIFDSQILNLSGGFLHGDVLGAGMCAANQIEHARIRLPDNGYKNLKDLLIEYSMKGNVIYGQCNGFQLLVKTGLLPGIGGDYSRQTVTLTQNDCGVYRVAPVLHKVERNHFAFKGIEDKDLLLWCRHGEGKMLFYSENGLISKENASVNRFLTNPSHILLRYAVPGSMETALEFPHNPNGSVDGIAGLVNQDGNIFGHMAHPEVSVYASRDPRWFAIKDQLRREGIKADQLDENHMRGVGLKIFENIVDYVR